MECGFFSWKCAPRLQLLNKLGKKKTKLSNGLVTLSGIIWKWILKNAKRNRDFWLWNKSNNNNININNNNSRTTMLKLLNFISIILLPLCSFRSFMYFTLSIILTLTHSDSHSLILYFIVSSSMHPPQSLSRFHFLKWLR